MIRRQITVKREVWKSIQDRAKLFGRTVGEYVSWLHAIQSKVVPLDEPVVREDRDLTEDERDIEVVQEAVDNALTESKSVSKRKAIQNPSSGTVDWRDEVKPRSKSLSIDPGGTGKKSKMK